MQHHHVLLHVTAAETTYSHPMSAIRFWEKYEWTLAAVFLHHKCHFISMSEPCCYVHQRIRRSPDVRRRRVYLWKPRRVHWNAIACSGMWSSLSRTSDNAQSLWAVLWHPNAVACASNLQEQNHTGTFLHEKLQKIWRECQHGIKPSIFI